MMRTSPATMAAPATFPSRSNFCSTVKPKTSWYQRIDAWTSLQVSEQPIVVARSVEAGADAVMVVEVLRREKWGNRSHENSEQRRRLPPWKWHADASRISSSRAIVVTDHAAGTAGRKLEERA